MSDSPSKHLWVSLLSAGVALAVAVAAWRAQGDFTLSDHVLETIGGLSLVAAALIVRWQRVDNRLIWLLYAAGLAWFVGDFQHVSPGWLAETSWAWSGWQDALLACAVLAFPTGTLRNRWERLLAITAVAVLGARTLSRMFLHVPADPAGYGARNRYLPITDGTAWRESETWLAWALTTVVLLCVATLAHRMSRSGAPGRRMLAPVVVAAIALAVTVSYQAESGWNAPLLGLRTADAVTTAHVVVAAAFAVGLLQLRHVRTSVVDLVKQLGGAARPERIGETLARALGDDRVQLLSWSPHLGGYVDESGTLTELPKSTPERAVTVIEADGAPVAAMVHDLVLLEDPGLVEAVAATVRLAVHNETLHSQLRAQLSEVAASRTRIVEAADAERRRIERNLHDGAQQRLLSAAVGLNIALQRLPRDSDPDTREAMKRTVAELGGAIEELRNLARGLHPAVLGESGLVAALESLVDRAPGEIVLMCDLEQEPPLAIATAAYFAVGEGLSNVTKHANADKIRVQVESLTNGIAIRVIDDGAGGAHSAVGGGLQGIRDRVSTLGGELHVESDSSGTTLEVILPCDWS